MRPKRDGISRFRGERHSISGGGRILPEGRVTSEDCAGGMGATQSLPSHPHAHRNQSPAWSRLSENSSTALIWSPAMRVKGRKPSKSTFTIMAWHGVYRFPLVYLDDLATHPEPDAFYLVWKTFYTWFTLIELCFWMEKVPMPWHQIGITWGLLNFSDFLAML